MNPFKPITNPMLCGTIELMKAEDTPEHRKMFMDEMIRARYLMPVVVTPTPQPDANGVLKLTAEHKIQFPMLSAKEGKNFFMAFTDLDELKKWNADPKQQTIGFSFNDYADMLFRKNKEGETSPALGFIINPFSSSVFVSREMVAKVVASQMAQRGMPVPPMPEKEKENAEEEASES